MEAEILVIGSGAGGAVVAATLAEAGRDVLLLEEGPPVAPDLATHTPRAMQSLYRNGGLAPILGRPSIAFVEGRCVGGSTEINSSFWHRTPESAAQRWQDEFGLGELSAAQLAALFDELEAEVRPVRADAERLPPSSSLFRQGLESIGAAPEETPRLQAGDPTACQFLPGARRSMSRTYLPRAERAGARLLAHCRVRRIRHRSGRVREVLAVRRRGGEIEPLRIRSEAVFVCGGAIQTPTLLRASGIRRCVGEALRVQPMVKVAARFDDILDAHRSVMPVYQLRDPWTGVFLGGSVFTPGFLGLALAESLGGDGEVLRDWRRMGIYYAACRGTGRGRVRALPGGASSWVHYSVSRRDRRNLLTGLERLCLALFAGGARRIHAGVRGLPPLESPDDLELLRADLPAARLELSTVHVSSSCPMGENEDRCAADSFGRMRGFENLYIADASAIPDAPGVNPQGTVMALALRSARHFLET